MKCESCRTNLEVRKNQKYRFEECGLNNITLVGIRTYYCPKCKVVSPEIPYMRQLHLLIGLYLIAKRFKLTGKEIRFLRKELGLMSKEMARQLGYTMKNYSEIENDRHPISDQGDRLIRMWFLLNKEHEIRGYADEVSALKYQQALLEFMKTLDPPRTERKRQDISINPHKSWPQVWDEPKSVFAHAD